MFSNFILGLAAITREVGIFISVIMSQQLPSFMLGFITAICITGFILTENPRHIPLILRYSSLESFERIKRYHPRGLRHQTHDEFVKLYIRVRTIFYCAFIAFCIFMTTAAIIYRPVS